MKGYKIFNKGLVCKGKQYAEHTTFEEPNAEICKCGMHFCENPLDVLDYYPLIADDGSLNELADVEALADVKTDDNRKFCTTKLRIGAKISIFKLGEIAAGFFREKITGELKDADVGGDRAKQVGGNWAKQVGGGSAQQVGGDRAKQVGGYAAQQVGGNRAKQVGGDRAKQVGGYAAQQVGGNSAQQVGGGSAKQVGGNRAKQVGGDSAQQVGGNRAKQVGGDRAKQVGGYAAQQVGGDWAKQVGGNRAKQVGGDAAQQESGANSVIMAGLNSRFKTGMHSVVLHYWYDDDMNIAGFKAAQVDGEALKPDTWYKLENGEFVEAGDTREAAENGADSSARQ